MEYYNAIKQICSDLGISLKGVVPFVVLYLIIWFSINKKFNPIFEKVTNKVNNVEDYLIRLCSVIQSGGKLQALELYKKNSPLTITEKGYQALEQIGFKKAIDENIEMLFDKINQSEPKSAFDVENYSIGLIHLSIFNKDIEIFKSVEDFIYNNPDYNDPEYFKAAGLYLRDKYLAKHPELLPKK